MRGMEQNSGEPAGIGPHPKQQPHLTSALMSHLKFHVLNSAVSYLFLFLHLNYLSSSFYSGMHLEQELTLGSCISFLCNTPLCINVMFPSFEFLVSHLSFS